MWDLPGSGMEPVSPSLTGRFFTSEPPGKPKLTGALLFLIFTFFYKTKAFQNRKAFNFILQQTSRYKDKPFKELFVVRRN